MAVPQRVLIRWACCCVVALSGQTARADFLGVATVIRTDLTICQDTSQDDIDEPLTVCNFFVVFNDSTDRLLSAGNSDITTSDPAGFFQFPSPATDLSPDCASIPMIPALVCDSFITIGVDCDDGTDATRADGDWYSLLFNTAGQMVGGWFNAVPGNGQGDAGTYPNDLVLFLQIAIARGESVSGDIDVFWQDTNTGEIFAEVDMILECPGACPGDLNVDGRIGAFDLALLLGSWGENPGDPADLDGDGVVGATDLAILLGGWGPCCNGVGIADGAEPDADGDGFIDECDNCPELFNPTQNDCDENGIGDACTLADGIEGDCNDNGLPDNCEDCNENNIADECDLANGTSPDCNENEIPDECEIGPDTDCNANGIPDLCDLLDGVELDCNGNDAPDSCDIADGTSEDCTGNGVPDECEPDCNDNSQADSCDIADGTSADCAGEGIPDECEPDCNGNDIADSCDIVDGTSPDCDGNTVPDECQDTSADCNDNRIWDPCDIDQGTSEDRDGNGIPDECAVNDGLYVDDDAPGDPAPGDPSESDPEEDGTPDHPFDTIQEAIDAAVSGHTILVFPGTYFENINLLGKPVTLLSSAGSEVTIIDANGSGTAVVCDSGEGPDTVINGFTLTGGDAQGDFPEYAGGGMRIFQCSPTVLNCTISENTAIVGGGMSVLGSSSSPRVSHCTFIGNMRSGMVAASSSPTVTHCAFIANTTTSDGAGMLNSASSTKATDCIFIGNTADSRGGGMGNFGAGSPTVSNCVFIGNSANRGGGMVNENHGSASVSNCTFIGNTAAIGGGMENYNHVTTTAINCTFIGNTAAGSGGGMNIWVDSSATVTNCTFSGNTAGNNGGGLNSIAQSSATVSNCVLWNNTPNQIRIATDSSSTVRYSNVQGDWPGEGNIDADPLFVDPDGPDGDPETFDDNDYRLAAGSPCIDAGDSDAILDCILDLDGHERFVDDPATEDSGTGGPPVVDMGAYEFGGEPLADCNGNAIPDECEGLIGPQITQQPVSQEVEAGELVLFLVIAEGVLLEYQWRRDGANLEDNEHILGSQSAGLVILEAVPADAGEYDCVITDFGGCQIVSDPATLTVLPP